MGCEFTGCKRQKARLIVHQHNWGEMLVRPMCEPHAVMSINSSYKHFFTIRVTCLGGKELSLKQIRRLVEANSKGHQN